MKRSKTSNGATYTAKDVAAAIASVDCMRSRLRSTGALDTGKRRSSKKNWSAALARLPKRSEIQPTASILPSSPDTPSPRTTDLPRSTSRSNSSPMSTQTRCSSSKKTDSSSGYSPEASCWTTCNELDRFAPSFDPQAEYERRRESYLAGLQPDAGCEGGFGEEVDAAFEECANAPW